MPRAFTTYFKPGLGLTITACLALLCAACGGGGKVPGQPERAEGELLESAHANVRVLPETYLAGGSARKLTLKEREVAGEVLLELHAQDAEQLKALYLHIEYDAAQLSPAGVDSEWRFADEQDTLQLSLASQPGVLEYGEQCLRPDEPAAGAGRRGFEGDGLLCSIRLARRPFTPVQRETAAPTIAARSATLLSLDNDSLTLSWGYASNGDYNQNGTVAVTDLTPIGAHFGEDVPDGDQNSIQAVIDGNGDGSVGVADLTAIGLNFNIAVNSYNIYASNSSDDLPASNAGPNGPGAELRGSAPFSSVQGDQFSARRSFSFVLAEAQAGWFYWVRPNDAVDGSGADGTPSSLVSFGGQVNNLDPLAQIEADPSSGGVPLEVSFDASGSSDPDGATGTITDIVQFQWDFDGNGVIDDVSSGPTVSHTYRFASINTARVRILDAGAASASASTQVGVGVTGNDTPVAALTANFTEGEAPLSVLLNAGDSENGEGSTGGVTFEWDFEGDGIFDLDTEQSSLVAHVYPSPGVFNPKVRVTDDIQQQATASIEVTVLADTGNLPPVASLQPDPLIGDAPGNEFIALQFDISGCSDADGFVARADLDLNGDGLPDRSFISSDGSVLPGVLAFSASPGIKTVSLLVTDNQGAQASTTAEVRISNQGNFPPTTVLEADPTEGDTPLLVNFDASASSDIEGPLAGFEFNFDFNADFENFEPDADGIVSHTYENGGQFLAIAHAIDSEGLKSSVSLVITVNAPNNQPPQASFTLTPDSGDGPLTITADASASSDADGTVVNFEWDLFGDGTFASVDTRSDGQPFTFVGMNKGTTTVSLRVTDSDGATDVTTRELTLNKGWEFGPIASVNGLINPNQNGGFDQNSMVSLAAIATGQGSQKKAGLAFMATQFFNEVLEGIKYTECSPADPLSWSTPVTVTSREDEDNGLLSLGHALQDVSGRPALAFGAQLVENGFVAEGGLFYMRADDPQGSAWPEPLELTKTDDGLGQIDNVSNPGLVMIDGQPGIGCLHQTGILFARADDAVGSDWNKLVIAVEPPGGSKFLDLARLQVVEGRPSFVYADCDFVSGFFSPNYVLADTLDGVDWGTTKPIADGEALDLRLGGTPYLGAEVVKSLPAAFFSSGFNTSLYYERGETAEGGFSDDSIVVKQVAPEDGISFAVVDGRPCFVFSAGRFGTGGGSQALFFMLARDAVGDEWHSPVPIASGPGNNVVLTAVLRLNKDVLIVYGDFDDQQLKAALFRDFEAF